MRKWQYITGLLLMWMLTAHSYAQVLETKLFLPDTCNRDIFFRLESAEFFKNNEYFTPYTASYTWPGFYLKPTLEYYITPSTRLSLGYYFEKFFGWDNFFRTVPIFSIQQRITQDINLIFGNLYGTVNHGMEEAILGFDRYMTKPVEYGIQLIYRKKKLAGDTWLNWERFIYFNSTVQEEIQFGHNSTITLLTYPEVTLKMPLQILVYHRGGHLLTPVRILTVADIAYGMRIEIPEPRHTLLSIETLMFLYQGLNVPDTGRNHLPYPHGSSFYFKLKYKQKNFNAMIGLWMPTQYIAPEGEYLLSNISELYTTYYEQARTVITAKISHSFILSATVKAQLNAGLYYDPWESNLAYYYGLYFTINQPFYLGRINPEKVNFKDLNFHKKF